MDHFSYKDGALCAEDVPIARIAQAVGTPFYCYASATIERHYRVFTEALAGLDTLVCFAVKSNGNLSVIRTLACLGAGADVVSGGELTRALAAGVPAERIVFSGVGKTEQEIELALIANIAQINVESEPELAAVDRIAGRLGKKARVSLRINPDVDAHTHAKITTGLTENKFGIEWTRAHEVVTRARQTTPNVDIAGLAVHIGSQLTDLEPFRAAFIRLRDVVAMLRADGATISHLDLGGGLGIPYDGAPTPLPAEYGQIVRETVGDLGCRLVFEPGRLIVGNAGVLVTKVVYVKDGATRRFVIVDAAMNDLLRPALYEARHEIVPVAQSAASQATERVDVVGPVCETGDTFASGLALPPVGPGDLLAIRTAGAYGSVMSSTYNSRDLIPEVLVKGSEFAVVRRRIGLQTFLDHEQFPAWLEAGGEPVEKPRG